MEGRMNEDTGNPEILVGGNVVAKGRYEGIAIAEDIHGRVFVVFGDYWAGFLPTEYLGKLLRLQEQSMSCGHGNTARKQYKALPLAHNS